MKSSTNCLSLSVITLYAFRSTVFRILLLPMPALLSEQLGDIKLALKPSHTQALF